MLGAVREDAIFTRLFAAHWATLSGFLYPLTCTIVHVSELV
jgi:hypothetical protein